MDGIGQAQFKSTEREDQQERGAEHTRALIPYIFNIAPQSSPMIKKVIDLGGLLSRQDLRSSSPDTDILLLNLELARCHAAPAIECQSTIPMYIRLCSKALCLH